MKTFCVTRDRYQLTLTAARLHRAVRDLMRRDATATAATLAPAVLDAQLGLIVDLEMQAVIASASSRSTRSRNRRSRVAVSDESHAMGAKDLTVSAKR
jgi:hypothetical protein